MASKQANGANGLLAECYPSKKSSGMSFGCFVWAIVIIVVIVIVVIVLL